MFPIRDHNPSDRMPIVTYALVALNIAAFLLYFWKPEAEIYAFFDDWALFPARVTTGESYIGLFTTMFLHGGLMHIGGNMLFLYIFGDNLEDHFGHVGFLMFYLASGFVASAAHIVADPMSMTPTVGASGAIAGVMGGYLLLFPRAKVDVLILAGYYLRTVLMPAYAMLGVWIALQIFSGVTTIGTEGGGVAYWAHVGGFVAGLALVAAGWALGARPKRIDGRPANPPTNAPSRTPIVRRGR